MRKIYLVGLAIIGIILLFGCVSGNIPDSVQHGTSRDIVYGYDHGAIWGHMYLKNDHTTVYCFKDDYKEMFDESIKDQKEIIVEYDKGIFTGGLCSYDADKYEGVVVTGIKRT